MKRQKICDNSILYVGVENQFRIAQHQDITRQKTSRLAEATRARINDIIYTYYIIYSIMSDKQNIIN